jgi:DNA-binding NarL/FixJ family response regulator
MVDRYRRQTPDRGGDASYSHSAEPPPKKPKTPRVDTKQISLDLFEKGLTLAQIAETRGLVLATIESHMAHWVETGRVAIDALLSQRNVKPSNGN